MPHKSLEQIERERIANIPANREKALQEALMDIPRIGHGQTEPEALSPIRCDLNKKTGTPIYVDREVKLS